MREPVKEAGESLDLRIKYRTTEECAAIQWLNEKQTVGKKHPYLFTQCEVIYH